MQRVDNLINIILALLNLVASMMLGYYLTILIVGAGLIFKLGGAYIVYKISRYYMEKYIDEIDREVTE